MSSPNLLSGWPQFLPDGKHFLFYEERLFTSQETVGTYVASLDGATPKLILRGGSDAVYAPPGYLLFVRDRTLMAQAFDANKLHLTGEAVPVASSVALDQVIAKGIFSLSDNGALIYGESEPSTNPILWFDRTGKQIARTGAPGDSGTPSISPDGSKLAVSSNELGKPDVWVYDLARGVKTRVTFASGPNADAFWAPDGKHVCFASTRSGRFQLYEKAADGTGRATPLIPQDDAADIFGTWSADGRYLAYQRNGKSRRLGVPENGEIWAMPQFGERKPFPVVQNGQFTAVQPALSPDGKWLAYVSNESGRREVYVVPFPHGNRKWRISSGGGIWPRWSRDGRELFYRAPDSKFMAAEITRQGENLVIGKVHALFQANPAASGLGPMYDVSADGKRSVVVSESEQGLSKPLTLVLSWPALLKKQ